MRRVMHLINGESYAGAERVQDLLALAMPDFGYRIGFVCLKEGVFSDRRISNEAQAPLLRMPMQSQVDLSPVREIARVIQREGYDLVHTHTPRSALIGRLASWMARVPMVHHVHSPTTVDTENAWRNRMNAWMETASLVGVSQIITVSESLAKRMIQSGWHLSRINVVPNGVRTPPKLHERMQPAGTWTFGVVAYFRPRKGLETLIDALARLRAGSPGFRVVAVGAFESPHYEEHIKSLVRSHGLESAFEWTGFASDVAAQLRRMDALVVPSHYGEGMPMVVLEGMAAGVPVVATTVEGIPEVIAHGESGILVAPQDAAALAAALTSLMTGEYSWDAFRRAAFARQRDLFSEVAMARGVAQVYARALGETPPHVPATARTSHVE